jgi:hypothetical protein
MNTKLTPETLVTLQPQLEKLRQIDRTLTETEAEMRRIVENNERHVSADQIQNHIEIMRQFFARTERTYNILVEANLDDPVTAEFIALFADRISKKDEMLAYWRQMLNTKLS